MWYAETHYYFLQGMTKNQVPQKQWKLILKMKSGKKTKRSGPDLTCESNLIEVSINKLSQL